MGLVGTRLAGSTTDAQSERPYKGLLVKSSIQRVTRGVWFVRLVGLID